MSFQSFLTVGAVLSGYLGRVAKSDGATAVWKTENNYIEGEVNVTDGRLVIALDIKDLMANDYMGIPGTASCFDNGLKFHIHELWTHTSNDDSLTCGSDYTGGHWDPWLACGSATGNDYCTAQGGCVAGSSVLGDTGYDCSESTFASDPYACEVGDWNGKYGKVLNDNGTLFLEGESAYEVDGSDVVGLSVVFHCGDSGDRAFCAPFVAFTDSTTRPTQADDFTADYKFAMFNEKINGMVTLNPDGTTEYMVDFDETSYEFSDTCTELTARIYDSWDDSLGYSSETMCDDAVGMFYDPTVSCAMDSDNSYCMYNTSDGNICGEDVEYSCDYTNNRFLCAPGDLTGKFGNIVIPSPATGMVSVSEVDDIMIDLNQLDGTSIVFQCNDVDSTIIACAGLYDAGTTVTDASDSGDSDDAYMYNINISIITMIVCAMIIALLH